MSNFTALRPIPAALPATRADLIRKSASKQNLNDMVETIVLTLWNDDTFQSYIEPVWNEQSVEGTLYADDIQAAGMIRDQAKKDNNPAVANQKLAVLAKVLTNVVLRRYGISRNERRQAIAA